MAGAAAGGVPDRDPGLGTWKAIPRDGACAYAEREDYDALLREFAELDVPWKSYEDAACRWIVEGDPGFFENSLPFLGNRNC
ncbi:MAG: hypothetical protein JXR55_00180 [Candidatus Fermentibacteraceae bacterium]|nr:hypothetical protein [Candidatus Fermentibacteraceae bacterium]